MFEPSGFSLEIFKDRYAFTQDEDFPSACRRVADQMARAELPEKQKNFSDRFFEILSENLFVPGGRIWYNSGRHNPQLLNCFVLNPEKDSREGWGRSANDMISTSMTGGGCGDDFSDVRPRGASITGQKGEAPGAIELMRLIDACAKPVKNGGQRRVALMFSLDLDHPDVEEFLSAKLTKGELSHANVSVRSKRTKEFIKAVKQDGEWELTWKGKYRRTVKARDLWNTIVTNAYNSAEPGFLNWELVESESNIYYIEPLITTNPCKPLDATILTKDGYITFAEALTKDRLEVVTADGKIVSATKPFKTGENREVMRVKLSNGRWLKGTPNHRHMKNSGEWCELGDLQIGDRLKVDLTAVHSPEIRNEEDYRLGVLAGWIWGDGSISEGKSGYVVQACFGDKEFDWAEEFSQVYGVNLRPHKQRPETCKVTSVNGEWKSKLLQLPLPFIKRENGLNSLNKNDLSWTRGMSASFKLGFLRAYFTADGSVRKGGISALYSTNREALEVCAEMLNEFGIYASMGRRALGKQRLGNYGIRNQKENYFLEVMFSEFDRIGFLSAIKNEQLKLRHKNNSIRKTLVRTSVRVTEIERNHSFEDVYDITVDHESHLFLDGGIVTHNCGEIALSAYDCCCLGHMVLPRFVKADGTMDFPMLGNTIRTAVRFLDNVLTVNSYPLPEMKAKSNSLRRIGLGTTGLADALALMGLRYGGEDGNKFIDKLYRFISKAAYEASVMLAVEKGMFPLCEPKKHAESGFMKRMPEKIRALVAENGIRNCCILTQAPTGTVSILSDNCSSGIEPMFAAAYERRFWKGEERKMELVFHPLFARFMREGKDVAHFVGSQALSVRDHLEVQAIVQKHVDNAVSKTVNIAKDCPMEEVEAAWLEYLPKLKGTTFYREDTRGFVNPDGSVAEPPLKALSLEDAQAQFVAQETIVEDTETNDCASGACEIRFKK